MNRGEIWWVNFSNNQDSTIKKRRPAIIVSNNMANQYANRVQVIPLTSNVAKLYPCDAEIMVGKKPSKAMADQLTTVGKARLDKRLGCITNEEMQRLEHAIRIQLSLII